MTVRPTWRPNHSRSAQSDWCWAHFKSNVVGRTFQSVVHSRSRHRTDWEVRPTNRPQTPASIGRNLSASERATILKSQVLLREPGSRTVVPDALGSLHFRFVELPPMPLSTRRFLPFLV